MMFFFKQKTAYEMRISDWSSDVCSSDLLVAALFFLDLDDQFLAFADGLLDARRAHIDSFLEITARDFLERQEAVTLFAITDEAGFQARLDAGDDAFVDVSLAL